MKIHTLFRIFYLFAYLVLYIALVVLLVITPGDAIRQALNNRQLYNVFVIAGAYFVTGLLAVIIWASRLYTNRSVLQAIPKTWIPVEKGDVDKKVRKMIVGSLARSAAVAWDSRPRIPQQIPTVVSEPEARESVAKPAETEAEKREKEKEGLLQKGHSQMEKEEHTITIPPARPVWGDISHPGWSSPLSPDLPDLQYTTVILELPHLIEARAVSLAPPDLESSIQPPLPDIRVVELLQRPTAMGLREYIGHLTTIGLITSPPIAAEFLAAYENARFSARPLNERQFRNLMAQFAELLQSMAALSPAVLASLDIETEESDIDGDASSSSTPVTQRSRSLASTHSGRSHNSSEGTIRTTRSHRAGNGSPSKRTEGYITAPATPRLKKIRTTSRSSSMNSFAQTRPPYTGRVSSSSSSIRSTGQGSVIRLSRTDEAGDLPYTLMTARMR